MTGVGGVKTSPAGLHEGPQDIKDAHQPATSLNAGADGDTPSSPSTCAADTPPWPNAQQTPDGILGWRAVELCRIADITYRQCDHWVRCGYLTPFQEATGSGSQRLFDAAEIEFAIVMADLVHAGVIPPRAYELAHDLRADGHAVFSARTHLVEGS